MTWSVQPEPGDDTERQALLSALEQVLDEANTAPAGYATPWWRSGLADLGGSAAAEQAWRESRVVEA